MRLDEFNPTIEIVEGENPGLRCSFQEFYAANEFESEYVKQIAESLQIGSSFTDGGGAAPIWTIRAVTDNATPEEIVIEKYLFSHGWQYGLTRDGWKWAHESTRGVYFTMKAAYEVAAQRRVSEGRAG